MLKIGMQYFGGRGSAGGKGGGGGGSPVSFKETEKQIRLTQPDGSTEVIQKQLGSIVKQGTPKNRKTSNGITTFSQTSQYRGSKWGIYNVTSNYRINEKNGKVTSYVTSVKKVGQF